MSACTRIIANKLGITEEKLEESLEKINNLSGLGICLEEKAAEELLWDALTKDEASPDLTTTKALDIYVAATDHYRIYKPTNSAYRSVIKDAVIEDYIFKLYGLEYEQLDTYSRSAYDPILASARDAYLRTRILESDPSRLSQDSVMLQQLQGRGSIGNDFGHKYNRS